MTQTATSTSSLAGATAAGARNRPPALRLVQSAVTFARRKPLGAAGAIFLVLMVLAALLADVLAPYNPITPSATLLQAPTTAHLMGTDHLGRDVLSRILYGARPSLYTASLVVLLTICIGTGIGLLCGYVGGFADIAIQRIIDALMGFPALILTLAVVSALGQRVNYGISFSVAAALIVVSVPGNARVVRSVTLSQRAAQYVEAARVIGCKDRRIVLRHILPNLMAPIIVVASVQLGAVILAESSLSFLGYGTPPPTPTWGGMLSSSATRFMQQDPWLALFPGLALSLAVLSFNLFGDALRDVLDPRLRNR
jgi:peptide/nickel transport system permease protein